MTDHVEGTADEITVPQAPVHPGQTELVPHDPQQGTATLFRTDDPVKVVEEATRVANALSKVLKDQGMLQRIGPKDHVKVEGWTTLGAMLGVVPVVTWTRKIDRGWEARVEARTLDGRIIGAAEAMCSHEERRWKDSDEYAVRSMAQTRATSKALANPLRFIVTLAGFEGTPAEEMPSETGQHDAPRPRDPEAQISSGQIGKIKALIRKEKPKQDELRFVLAHVTKRDIEVKPGWLEGLNMGEAFALIDVLSSGAIPTGKSDIPEPGEGEFVHPVVDEDGQEVFSPEAPQ